MSSRRSPGFFGPVMRWASLALFAGLTVLASLILPSVTLAQQPDIKAAVFIHDGDLHTGACPLDLEIKYIATVFVPPDFRVKFLGGACVDPTSPRAQMEPEIKQQVIAVIQNNFGGPALTPQEIVVFGLR